MMKKKAEDELNICFVAPFPPPYGGIANWTAMLCHHLDSCEKGNIQYSVINSAPKKRVTEGRLLWNRIVDGGFNMIKISRALKRKIRSERIDCIHITTSGQLAFIRDIVLLDLARKWKIRTIYHIRFGRIPEIMMSKGWERSLLKAALKRCNIVISIDERTYQTLKYSDYSDKICHIPLPIDIKELPKIEKNRANIVNFVGWVIPAKGIEELLEAWEKVSLIDEEWQLQLIGPYHIDYYNYLKEKYTCTNVTFCGEQTHGKTLELINLGKVFILPSYSEGFPNAVAEAMALRLTVIATEVGAIPEMLAGGCGYLIPRKNSNAIFRALKNVISNGNVSCGELAGEKVLREYEITKVVERYKNLWRG